MRKDDEAEAAACGPCSGLHRQPATRDGCSPSSSEHPASHNMACQQSCHIDSSSGGSGSAADSTAVGGRQGIAGQGLEPAGQSGRRASKAVNGAAAGRGQGVAGLGSGAGFVPARTAEYLEPGFWQRRFERGDAHEWFGGYAAFRALLAPRLTPGRRRMYCCPCHSCSLATPTQASFHLCVLSTLVQKFAVSFTSLATTPQHLHSFFLISPFFLQVALRRDVA